MALDFPSGIGKVSIYWQPSSTVVSSTSLFTKVTQSYAYSGKKRLVSIEIPPLVIKQAKELHAFFCRLNGSEGTFLIGDGAGAESSGNYTGEIITVTNVSSDRSQITVSGFLPNVDEVLAAGDWIGVRNRLYTVTNSIDSDTNGHATIDLWPNAKPTLATSDTLAINDAKGEFRLTSWPAYGSEVYLLQSGFILEAEEVVT